jgi:hypothetical protein
VAATPADAVEPGGLLVRDGGLWIERRDAAAELPSDELLSIPYVSGTTRPEGDRGVTVFESGRAQDGVSLYSSAHAAEAFLIDMRGRVLHRWAHDRDRVWPDAEDGGRYFRRVHAFPDGDLLAIYEYVGIVRLDRDSNVRWAHRGGNHHDLDVGDDGRIYVLGSDMRRVALYGERTILADDVTVLSARGEPLDRIDIAACLAASDPKLVERARAQTSTDPFHTNTIQLLDGRAAARSPVFARGNLLVSLRNLGVVGIVDPAERRFVWALWGPWSMQHEPVLLPGGTMLLFDNRTVPAEQRETGASRVIEFDPLERRIVWEYAGTPERPLYSSLCGTAARLDNGNTLVTESDYGRAFEVTPGGEIVWQFDNPHLAGPAGELVALIPELIRLPRDFAAWRGR